MRVSLNLIKKYIDLPKNLTNEQISYDLTLKTVEVEDVIDMSKIYENIVVGKIINIENHPNADKLKVCKVDIGLSNLVQIVCGGSNLYVDEYVVVSKPGAKVVWHGEGEPVEIKETQMRGVDSYGMICASSEINLSDMFPSKEDEIIDLKDIECYPGQDIIEIIDMDDTILEIDNKSLSNRPDLWGHYGIARELSTIYNVPLKEIDTYEVSSTLPKYKVLVEAKDKCSRYSTYEIDGIYNKKSPIWMQSVLLRVGLRPINAIVDITNYVMIVTGEPLHAFDKTHVNGEEIIIRNAKENEELILLDDNTFKLTKDDLVIADINKPLALAGIMGGKDDSILDTTEGIVLEIASFTPSTIRKTEKRLVEKTEASNRFDKGIDTERVDVARNLCLKLIEEIFPESHIVKYNDVINKETLNNKISISEEFLNRRLGKVIPKEKIKQILTSLGYKVELIDGIYSTIVPTYRSTGDVSIKDDVMGDIARIIGYNSFEPKPIEISINNYIENKDKLLERRIKEYLSNECNSYEIYTYPWIDEKYIKASKIDISTSLKLATPPAPELSYLKASLVPGLLEAISKNLRYYDEFNLYELAEVYKEGDYRPSSNDEILPIQTKYLTGCVVGKDAKEIFYEAKGIIENMPRNCHMETYEFKQITKPSWADKNAYLNIVKNDEIIGSIGLLSIDVMNKCKIKRTNVAIYELNKDKLVLLNSRDNKYNKILDLPIIEKDLSIIIDENIAWKDIEEVIKPLVYKVKYIEEYYGNQIPEKKKSITFKIYLVNKEVSMTSLEINDIMNNILLELDKKYNAKLREE